jgi:hypothetical protein
MEEKKRQSAPAEAIAPFNAWRSPKETMSVTEYWRRRRSVAHCALNSSILAVRRSEARRAIPACTLDSWFDIFTPEFPNVHLDIFTSIGAFLPEPLSALGEGRNQAVGGTGRTQPAGTTHLLV